MGATQDHAPLGVHCNSSRGASAWGCMGVHGEEGHQTFFGNNVENYSKCCEYTKTSLIYPIFILCLIQKSRS
jgi:hypothetical protein